MEIKVNIPKNDYVQPTEIRQEVVQGICDAFLCHCAWSVFHPNSDGYGRYATNHIVSHGAGNKFYGFHCDGSIGRHSIRFNGAEMKAAFSALVKAGYHMFEIYSYGTWRGYICDKKPYRQGAREVTSFNDFID